jgi:hypothetical protein
LFLSTWSWSCASWGGSPPSCERPKRLGQAMSIEGLVRDPVKVADRPKNSMLSYLWNIEFYDHWFGTCVGGGALYGFFFPFSLLSLVLFGEGGEVGDVGESMTKWDDSSWQGSDSCSIELRVGRSFPCPSWQCPVIGTSLSPCKSSYKKSA